MQDSDQDYSDEDLYESLFAWGSSDEEDAIRERMTIKFKEIACISLPIADNPPLTYPSLENYPRFKEGLQKLGSRILKESETPLNVTVGDIHTFGECSIDTVGETGHQGAKGNDGFEGSAGYPGMDAETAEEGEEGSRGQYSAINES